MGIMHLHTAKYLLVKIAHDKSIAGTYSDLIDGIIFSISWHQITKKIFNQKN